MGPPRRVAPEPPRVVELRDQAKVGHAERVADAVPPGRGPDGLLEPVEPALNPITTPGDLVGTQPLDVLQHVEGLGADKIAWGRYWIQRGLDRLEQAVGATAGRYCVGDALSVADLCLIPQLYNARRFGCDAAGWTHLNRIEEACVAQPAFVAADPARQPDAQA